MPPNGLVNLASSTYSHTPCSLSHEETARWAAAFAPMLAVPCPCAARAAVGQPGVSERPSADLEHVRAREVRGGQRQRQRRLHGTHKRARHARRPRTPAYARVHVARYPVPDSQVHVACLVA